MRIRNDTRAEMSLQLIVVIILVLLLFGFLMFKLQGIVGKLGVGL